MEMASERPINFTIEEWVKSSAERFGQSKDWSSLPEPIREFVDWLRSEPVLADLPSIGNYAREQGVFIVEYISEDCVREIVSEHLSYPDDSFDLDALRNLSESDIREIAYNAADAYIDYLDDYGGATYFVDDRLPRSRSLEKESEHGLDV